MCRDRGEHRRDVVCASAHRVGRVPSAVPLAFWLPYLWACRFWYRGVFMSDSVIEENRTQANDHYYKDRK